MDTVVKFYQTGTFTVGNRLLAPEQRTVQANMQRTNSLNSGHRACQGCGEALGARYAIDAAMNATRGRLIAANATGCLEVFSTPYPETSWQIPWIHSLFGNAAAVGTGIAAAMRVKGRDDVRVVAQGGDGGTTDNSVERFLGDEAIQRGWKFDAPAASPGKQVLVVGAGPSGLSAAYHLARLGHRVTVHEAGPKPGGMMRFGIPKYRLPRDVLDAEVQRIVDLGVRIDYGTRVENILATMKGGGFDAAFLAVGAHIARRAFIPAGDSARVLDAISVLRSMEGEEPPLLGRRVVVYGGGNTAIDMARTAKRLGATEAIIVYRRTREKMPAHDFEVEEALEEGVMIKWLSTIRQAGDGAITVEKMALDDEGFPQPTGELETLEADSLVLALGQDVDLSLLNDVPGLGVRDGVVQVDQRMMTGHAGIFAGGDMVPAERNVTVAIGHGKKAARHIDAWLRGGDAVAAPKHPIARYEMLNPWYYADAPKTVRPMLDIIRRRSTFDEVQGGLDESNALYEARRCLSCGNCFECDNCYGVCPDNAVVKLGPGKGFEFNYDYCKGCGICVSECPCGAIEMVPECL